MSAPHDSIMNTDDNANTAADNTRFDQPSDAVPMDNMQQQQQPQDKDPKAEENRAGNTETTNNDEPTSDSPVKDEAELASGDNDVSSGKGKDKVEEPSTRPPARDRADSINAIGEAVDEIKNLPSNSADAGPVCNITLLLTTGSRHPYKLDAKYLAKRNVQIPEETEEGHPDPFSISIYTLKELILREWRSDWEAKPPSPTSIRLIHFGKLLDDKEPLKKYQFSPENPNVVHMSIRPQDLDEEDPRSGSKHLSGSGGEPRIRAGGCCVIL